MPPRLSRRRANRRANDRSRRRLLVEQLEDRLYLAAPTILSPDQSTYIGREGETLEIPFRVASPLDNNTLKFSYSVDPLPAGAQLQNDLATTQRRFVWWPGLDQAGTYGLTFAVTDEFGNRSSQLVTVAIADRTDGTPAMKVMSNPSYNEFPTEPSPYSFVTSAGTPTHYMRIDIVDPENPSPDAVTVNVSGLPTGFQEPVQCHIGYCDGTWRGPGTILRLNLHPTESTVGTHVVTVTATDGDGKVTSVPVTITVRPFSQGDNLLNFYPHVFTGAVEGDLNISTGIQYDVVRGSVELGVVFSKGGQGAISPPSGPTNHPAATTSFRLLLLSADGTERQIGDILRGDQTATFDTTQLPDGYYALTVDLLEGDLSLWQPWTTTFIVDNNGTPGALPQTLPIVGTRGTYTRWNLPNGKFAVDWVTVPAPGQEARPTSSYPYPFQLIAPPQSAAEQNALIPDSAWFLETTTKVYSTREEVDRYLLQSAGGHVFFSGAISKGQNALTTSAESDFIQAERNVGFDGVRNDNQVHDYSHYTPDPSSTGFIGVEPSGRIFRVARDGTVTTLFGPRLKRDVIRYDPYDPQFHVTEQQRQGQLEFIGQFDTMLDNPWDLVFDPFDAQILYVADMNNHRIAKVDFHSSIPVLSTLAGQTGISGYADGPANQARFNGPISLTADPATGVLYVSDKYNHVIRKIDRDGTVSTVVGQGPTSVPGLNAFLDELRAHGRHSFMPASVPISDAVIYYPHALRIDSHGNLVFSEGATTAVRRVNLATQMVEGIRIVTRDTDISSKSFWMDVDRRGNVGPVDDIIVADKSGVEGGFYRMSADGSRYTNLTNGLFFAEGAYNAYYGAGGNDPLAHAAVIDDDSAAIGIISRHRQSLAILRPALPTDVLAGSIDTDAFINGRATAAAGTVGTFAFDQITPGLYNQGAIALSLRPSLFGLYGASGQAFVGALGTFDDLADRSDAELAQFIRRGMGATVARPEITGLDLRDLIYFIRADSVQGKSQAPDLTAISSNLQAAGLLDISDSRTPEIRDVVVTPLSDTVVEFNWVTDESTIGLVQYGTDSNLGQFSAIEPSFGKQHHVVLRNLLPDRQYHFRISQKDLTGNLTVTEELTFEVGDPDIVPPTVPANLTVNQTTATSLSLGWDVATDAVELAGYQLAVSTSSTFDTHVAPYNNVFVGNVTGYVATNLEPETTYFARVRAVDKAGNVSPFGDIASATLPQAPPNTAPTVEAGQDQATTVLDAVTLDATVTDDGLPRPASLSFAWSQVSGPGTVTFSATAALDTSATFSAQGEYVLQLAASDGELTATDTVVITVNAPPGGGLLAHWRFDGDAQDSARSNHGTLQGTTFATGRYSEAVVLDGASQVVVNDPGKVLTPSQITIAAWVRPAADKVNSYTLTRGDASTLAYELRTTYANQFLVRLRNREGQDSPFVYFGTLRPGLWTHVAVAWDGVTLKTYQDGVLQTESPFSGSGINQSSRPLYVGGTAWGTPSFRGAVDDLRVYATALDGVVVQSLANNTAPVVEAGADQELRVNELASLDATVTDDGLPAPPAALTYHWKQVSGPGQVTFGAASAADTTAAFSAVGTYELELAASDGDFTSQDRMTVHASPSNAPPVVEAGADQQIRVNQSAILDATVTDDGLPAPATLTYHWKQVSGPGEVTFGDASAVDTTATFSAVGTYELELAASDGDLTTQDRTVTTVYAPPDAGLAAHWRFDGNAQDSAGSNHGTMQGAAFAVGRYGEAVVFDDPSLMVVDDPGKVLTPAKITIAGWVKPAQNKVNSYILARGDASSLAYELRTTYANQFLGRLRNREGQYSPYLYFGKLQSGLWTHVAVTWDGVTVKTYQDGVLQTETPFSGSGVNQSSRPLYVGASAWKTPSFRGAVDDLRVYATALDGAMVHSLASNAVPVVDAGADQEIRVNEVASLDATVTDDGLPAPAILTYDWTKVSGPGEVTFGNRSAVDTTARFSTVGTYELELAANDGNFTGRDRMTVTIAAEAVALTLSTEPSDAQFLSTSADAAFGGLASIENATGGSGDEALTGIDKNNVLNGGLGHDLLPGVASADTLQGNACRDLLFARFGATPVDNSRTAVGPDADSVVRRTRCSKTICFRPAAQLARRIGSFDEVVNLPTGANIDAF